MTTQAVPTVTQTTAWWSLGEGKGGKVTGSELLHGAVNSFAFVEADGSTATTTYDVDKRWMNNDDAPTRFAGVSYAGLRTSISGRVTTLAKTSCLLDQIMDVAVVLPTAWKWNPSIEHTDGITFTGGDPASAVVKAVGTHLVSVRGAIEARNLLMLKLNVREIEVVTNKSRPNEATETVKINWTPVIAAGRAAVIKKLQAGADLLGGPPSSDPYNRKMNELVSDDMIKADAGLTRLNTLGLIAINGTDGQPFKKKKGTTEMTSDRSVDLQAAYNHIRFLLYMEWRAVHELI